MIITKARIKKLIGYISAGLVLTFLGQESLIEFANIVALFHAPAQ